MGGATLPQYHKLKKMKNMKQTINSKEMLAKVAKEMTVAIRQAMAIFDEPAEVSKEENEATIIVSVSNKNTYLLTLAEVECVQKAVEPIIRVYGDNISCVFDAQPVILNLGMIHIPTMEFTIYMKKY